MLKSYQTEIKNAQIFYFIDFDVYYELIFSCKKTENKTKVLQENNNF